MTMELVPSKMSQSEESLVKALRKARTAAIHFMRDGTMVFATESLRDIVGHSIGPGLARSYEDHFKQSPELVEAITEAFQGGTFADTLYINGHVVDIRCFPANEDDGSLGGVVAVLTEAKERITALRAVRTIEINTAIQRHLARVSCKTDFLEKVCDVFNEIFPASCIVLANRDTAKSLNVIGDISNDEVKGDALLELTWDLQKKSGHQVITEAINAGRTTVVSDSKCYTDYDKWNKYVAAYDWKTIAVVPLRSEGSVIGAITVFSEYSGAFDKEAIAFLETIAEEVGDGVRVLELRAERNQIATEREEREQQYKRLVDTIFDVILMVRDDKVVDVNTAGVTKAGAASREALLGTPVAALIAPDDRKYVIGLLREQSPKPTLVEFRLLALNGNIIDVECVTSPVVVDGADAQLMVLRDITERSVNTEMLKRAKSSLEYTQRVAKLGYVELDLINNTTTWSSNAYQIIRGDEKEITNAPLMDMLRSVCSSNELETITSLLEQIRNTQKPATTEITISTTGDPQAKQKIIALHAIPEVERHVYVPRAFIVIRDVTHERGVIEELEKATQSLHRLHQYGMLGDFVIHGQQVTLSTAALLVLGMEGTHQADMSIDIFCRQVRHEDQLHLRNMIAILREKDVSDNVNSALVCRIDTEHLWRWIRIVLTKNHGAETIEGVVQDITESKKVEERLELLDSRLRRVRQVCRAIEWTYDISTEEIRWEHGLEEFLGNKPPVDFLPLAQFYGLIRKEDRDPIKVSINKSIAEQAPGEMVYEQGFDLGRKFLLFGRWFPEVENGKVIRMKGVSIDVNSLRFRHEYEEARTKLHDGSNLPEESMCVERMQYYSGLSDRYGKDFSICGIRLQPYRIIKRYMGDADFYNVCGRIAFECIEELPALSIDTIGRYKQGCFITISRKVLSAIDVELLRETFFRKWNDAIEQRRCVLDEPLHVELAPVSSRPEAKEGSANGLKNAKTMLVELHYALKMEI